MNLQIFGAKEHNLKNISLTIPRNELTVITGISGSGKSSLAFDTIYAEAQHEFVESLSSFARRYLDKTRRPDIDVITGLSPAILINQRALGQSPRSTVGTVTELYTLLRLLFSRIGTPALSAGDFSFNTPTGSCQHCKGLGVELAVDLDGLLDWNKSLAEGAIQHRTFKVGGRYWNIISAVGLFDMDKPLKSFDKEKLDQLLYSEPFIYKNEEPGFIQRFTFEGVAQRILKRQSDSRGLEIRSEDAEYLTSKPCSECGGSRLSRKALEVKVNGRCITEYSTIPLSSLGEQVDAISDPVAVPIVSAMKRSLDALLSLGVGYLTLNRSVDTLSGGESQRIKLARQLGSSLTELIYILDEPTSGLHARDTEQLLQILLQIRSKPNTVIVIEHDEAVIRHADHIVELGPGAGERGGELVAQGTPEAISNDPKSITGAYLSGRSTIPTKSKRKRPVDFVQLRNINHNNLKNVSVEIPTGVFTCLTGVSGSGKSSLVDVLLKRHSEIVVVDQSPVGKSPRSNPATYVKAFDLIRNEFADAVGAESSLFTFNGQGACQTCNGLGYEKVDMHFLEDMRLECEDCKGKRYNPTALAYKYQGKTIADVLDLTIAEAIDFFENDTLKQQLKLLSDVGLDYLRLGQPLDTLSGGEAQRVKLCSYLSKRSNFYVLDEPTRGLHTSDVARLLVIIERLVKMGNSVLLVEHNLDVIKNADWVIDLGPEGGKQGGEIIAQGTPETIAKVTTSYTAQYLAPKLHL